MANIPADSFTSTLVSLFEKGVRFSTVIDIGCSDGSFFLHHADMGIFPNAVPVNIDANAIYEESLKGIQSVFGGNYVIAAVTDTPGEIEITTSAHPYWNSIRPADDPYWERLNGLHQDRVKTPAVTLDDLAQKFDIKGPVLLKLDIQGAETAALRGARNLLAQTDIVICEADLDDFQSINSALVEAGFDFHDATQLNRLADRSLGWFYPVYLNRRLGGLRQRSFWDKAHNQQVIDQQISRRRTILTQNGFILSKHRALRQNGPTS